MVFTGQKLEKVAERRKKALGRARLKSHVLQFTRPRHEEWALGQDEGSKLCITPGKTGEPLRRSRDP